MNRFILIAILLCLFPAGSCKRTPKETAAALSAFKSLEYVLEKDGGALWGSALYAPTFLVNPETKVIYADRKDEQGLLQSLDGIWTGTFPEQMNPANSVAELGGMKWVMATWPLPESEFERNVLLVHETFHYRQPELGLDPEPGLCEHMENTAARIWLKMEWNALDEAIREENPASAAESIRHALHFRNNRLSEFPAEARVNEDAFIILEGLPEYTAYKLCCRDAASMAEQVLESRKRHWNNESFVYAFAYHSGLAYGYLLDRFEISWRSELKKDTSLPDMLEKALLTYGEAPPVPDSIMLKQYGYDTIVTEENEKEQEKIRIRDAFIHTFTRDTVLAIPLRQFNMGFTPVNVQSLGQLGTLYPNIRITGDFGILEVTEGGCLISTDWSTAFVPYKAPGWNLELEDGFDIFPPVEATPLIYRIAEM
ncbi:MAG: hypothetical protein KBC07_02555 [Bacteroidales bacterium]|jgi:hypothetical protein|nr:hypothetical protein [Bacteroidales bacterium]NLH23647.1 hypothetical protein [Bacteroidales bacterium]